MTREYILEKINEARNDSLTIQSMDELANKYWSILHLLTEIKEYMELENERSRIQQTA
jgi:hypothetical protein